MGHPPSMSTPPDQLYDVPRSLGGSQMGSMVGSQMGSQIGFGHQRQGSLISSQSHMNDYNAQVAQQQRMMQQAYAQQGMSQQPQYRDGYQEGYVDDQYGHGGYAQGY